MISYLLQAISTILFGSVFANIIIHFQLRDSRLLPGLYSIIFEAALDVANTILKTNLFVSFSVAIASLIRITQVPPVGEFYFMGDIAMFQGLITYGFYFSSLAYGDSFIFKYYFYQLSVVFLFLVGHLNGALPPSQKDVLEDLVTHCAIERDYPLAANGTVSRSILATCSSILTILFIGAAVFNYFRNSIQSVYNKLWNPFSANSKSFLLHVRPRSKSLRVVLVLATACWMALLISLMVTGERDRQRFHIASDSSNQDSQWGFGQVVAVMSWAPVLHDISIKVFRAPPPPDPPHTLPGRS